MNTLEQQLEAMRGECVRVVWVQTDGSLKGRVQGMLELGLMGNQRSAEVRAGKCLLVFQISRVEAINERTNLITLRD